MLIWFANKAVINLTVTAIISSIFLLDGIIFRYASDNTDNLAQRGDHYIAGGFNTIFSRFAEISAKGGKTDRNFQRIRKPLKIPAWQVTGAFKLCPLFRPKS